jgi:hypothetical protein
VARRGLLLLLLLLLVGYWWWSCSCWWLAAVWSLLLLLGWLQLWIMEIGRGDDSRGSKQQVRRSATAVSVCAYSSQRWLCFLPTEHNEVGESVPHQQLVVLVFTSTYTRTGRKQGKWEKKEKWKGVSLAGTQDCILQPALAVKSEGSMAAVAAPTWHTVTSAGNA